MPTPVALAIGIIGGSLIAVKAFGHKETEAEQAGATPQGQNTDVNVGANADTIGYDRISEEQYKEQGGVEAGQSHTVINDNGQVVGEVVGLEGGNQVFQEANGDVHIRSAGEPEVEPVVTGNVSTTVGGIGRGVTSTVNKRLGIQTPPIMQRPAPKPMLSVTKPKRAVSSAVQDQRIRAAARSGLRLPM